MNDVSKRRTALKTAENPNKSHDYVVSLKARHGKSSLIIRYVPDREILLQDCLPAYLSALAAPSNLIETANIIMQDLGNELIARWLQVCLINEGDGTEETVYLEETQPQWENPALMNRLEKI